MNSDGFSFLAWFIPLCSIAAGVLIWAIRTRPANVNAETAAMDAQWKRQSEYTERLEERCKLHEKEIEACHSDRDEARAEAIKWKLIAEAGGQMRQDAAIAAAAERLAEHNEREQEE